MNADVHLTDAPQPGTPVATTRAGTRHGDPTGEARDAREARATRTDHDARADHDIDADHDTRTDHEADGDGRAARRGDRSVDPVRGPVRRLLETRGWVGGFTVPHGPVDLVASDGTALRGSYLTTPAPTDTAVVIAHGFAAHHAKPSYARLAERVASAGPAVLALDLRGHGGSAGRCTLGDREAADLAGAVAWLRAAGHGHVTVVGASMGATATLGVADPRTTPAAVQRPDAAVLISAPARYRHPPPTEPLQRLHALWSSPMARTVLRHGLGVDLAGPAGWRDPPHPVDLARGVQVPLLIVHGADDGYFPSADADALGAASAGPSVVWHEPAGFGHAEDGFRPPFLDRLAAAVASVALTGRFPAGDASAR